MTSKSNLSKCERCGAEIAVKTSGRKKRFCSECIKKKQREYARAHYKPMNGGLSATKCKAASSEAKAIKRYKKYIEEIRANKKKYMENMKLDSVVSSKTNGDGSRTMWRGQICESGGRSEKY